jgi:hypothetical protein
MPVESYVAVRGWVYPRPPGQRNVVNVIRVVLNFYVVLHVVREIIALHTTSVLMAIILLCRIVSGFIVNNCTVFVTDMLCIFY